ncbi:DNA polymerase III subunit delta' [Calidifontibacter sp. DB0510]|uniref:DNA polymerase III subunit delta' n=1 Tax=Metallococcus carri TaxID=1656884 RepID=A0A967AZQ0_9MICO|nr:DNA polymerase III subunit delta' [Metallococcus carri]NHN55387.1 DNA polymerase III subunit delta' [Metallococcus carri]NOP36464.1 DNA polymerase III subunit delta' [Calidifontibacter sp. DB2511S]
MSVWADVVGQPEVVDELQRAVDDPARMTHAWLLTGPPGSGRSTAARAFAAALQCPQGGCGECRECRTALDGSHADVTVLATQGLSIQVKDARELAALAQRSPQVGQWQVIIIEDADRLTERAADALLKALEEPVARTVWVLCAPSLEDVIVTIRSRSRHVRLRIPSVEAVAELLHRRDGIELDTARVAARAAQSHVGLARRLARDEGARSRRRSTLALPAGLRGLGDALRAAADLDTLAKEESASSTGERDAAEKARLLEQLGADPAARTQPPYIRSQVAALERDQKTRATRLSRDVIDRSLVDLLSFYRDALVVQWGGPVELVNADLRMSVQDLANALPPEALVQAMDAIGTARERIEANVAPLLALEAMMISLQAVGAPMT